MGDAEENDETSHCSLPIYPSWKSVLFRVSTMCETPPQLLSNCIVLQYLCSDNSRFTELNPKYRGNGTSNDQTWKDSETLLLCGFPLNCRKQCIFSIYSVDAMVCVFSGICWRQWTKGTTVHIIIKKPKTVLKQMRTK